MRNSFFWDVVLPFIIVMGVILIFSGLVFSAFYTEQGIVYCTNGDVFEGEVSRLRSDSMYIIEGESGEVYAPKNLCFFRNSEDGR